MSTPKDGRQVITGDDWMRSHEKRVMHEERRPRINGPGDLLGPGFRAYAVQITDWNSETARFNGMWVALDAANAPTPTGTYYGFTIASVDGTLLQVAYRHDATPTEQWTRCGHGQVAGTPTYDAWTELAPPVPPGAVVFLPTADPLPSGWAEAASVTAPTGLRAISRL